MIERVHPRRGLVHELRKGHSVLRAATTVALSSLVVPLDAEACLLDAGGPTPAVWDALSVDASRRILSMNLSASRKPDVVADLTALWPIAEASVDLVVCNYVLEHLFRPRPVFAESFRCLKAGGSLVLTTVLIHAKHASPHDYFRFTDDGLRRLAGEVGFESETVALLAGPFQTIAAMMSPFLLTAWIRLPAVFLCRAIDAIAKRILPFVGENYCAGYVLVARKPPAMPD